MMWAADFDESLSWNLAQNCLEPLVLPLPYDLGVDGGEERNDTDEGNTEGGSHPKHANVEPVSPHEAMMKSLRSNHSFCGLTRSFLLWNGHMHVHSGSSASRSKEDELPVFCVAAILILNRHKIINGTHSIDDLIKVISHSYILILHFSYSRV